MNDTLSTASFLTWLVVECGYTDVKPIARGRYVAIQRKIFTHSVVIGDIGDRFGLRDVWCYPDHAQAKAALDVWDGEGEPSGWHRHPASGRRLALEEGHIDGDGRRVEVGQVYQRL